MGKTRFFGSIIDSFKAFWRFRWIFRQNLGIESLLIALVLVSLLLTLAMPFLGKIILDRGLMKGDGRVVSSISIISAVIIFLKMTLDRFISYIKEIFSRRVKVRMARRIFRKVEKLSLARFNHKSVAECVSRVSSDLDLSTNIIVGIVPEVAKSTVQILLVGVFIFLMSKSLLLLVVVYQALLLIRLNLSSQLILKIKKEEHEAFLALPRVMNRLFSQIYHLKATGTMSFMMRQAFRGLALKLKSSAKTSRANLMMDSVGDILDRLIYLLIAFIAVTFVLKGKMTLGGTGAILLYLNQGINACRSFVGMCSKVLTDSLALERITDFFEETEDIFEKPNSQVLRAQGAIEFEDVSFGYHGKTNVLSGLNFMIRPAAKIALVGFSGSGKTTIINLMLRLYDPHGGRILFDGRDLRDFQLRSIYQQIGIVPQALFVSGGTIRENIIYGRKGITDTQLYKAAVLSEIHEFIQGLPEGYDTKLGEILQPLSQGQKQRIAIARAVLNRPQVLILDEACSALDASTEDRILNNIQLEFPASTIILISHRLSAVMKMDQVYFLKDPASICIGSHEELFGKEPLYADLFRPQMLRTESDQTIYAY